MSRRLPRLYLHEASWAASPQYGDPVISGNGRARKEKKQRTRKQTEPPGGRGNHSSQSDYNPIAVAIGGQVRDLRTRVGLTGVELAARAGLSVGMVSKIERGVAMPSIESLDAVAQVFGVPLSALLVRHDNNSNCTYVPRGGGAPISRLGRSTGQELLARSTADDVVNELYLVTLSKLRDPALSSYLGSEIIYVLQGKIAYQHFDSTYALSSGDVLMFDSAAPHGPLELLESPVSYLSWRHRARKAMLI